MDFGVDKNPYTFIDHETNQEYIVHLTQEEFQRAERDMIYATEILNRVKNSESVIIDEDEPGNDNIFTASQQQGKEDEDEINTNNVDLGSSSVDDGTDCGDTDSLLWSTPTTLYCLELFKGYEERLSKEQITQKTVFEKISTQMAQKKYFVTCKQCASKMTSLKRTYKNIKDHNSKSGNDRRTWQYFAVVDEIFCKKPWVEPLATASSTPDTQSQGSVGAVQTHTEIPRKRKIKKALEQYLERNLDEKREQRAEKLLQHREKMAKLDQMNDFLNKLIQGTKKSAD